jgi:integrase
MHTDGSNPGGKAPKGKKYPITHKRPTGRIIERGQNQFQVWLHSHTDAVGKPIRYKKTFKTLKEADAHLAAKVTEKGRGQSILDTSERFEEFVRTFLTEIHAARVRPHSHANVRFYFECYILPHLGHRKVRDLTTMDFILLYKKLREYENPKTHKRLSATTIRKVHSTINTAMKSAVYHGKLSKNPVEKACPGRAIHREIQTFTESQVRQFLKVWDGYEGETSRHFAKHSLGPLWPLAFETGMRPEEYIGLRWKDVTLAPTVVGKYTLGPRIHVVQVAVRNVRLKGFHFGEPKTRKSRRVIPITQDLADALNAHRVNVERMREKADGRWRDYDLVFPNTSGEPLYDYRLRLLFKKIIEKLGLDPALYSLYSMRHTMATLALKRNVNPKVVAERLGHDNIRQTMDTYSHVMPSLQYDATLTLGEAIYGSSRGEAAASTEPRSVDVDISEEGAPF